jgi:hypothetical protein
MNRDVLRVSVGGGSGGSGSPGGGNDGESTTIDGITLVCGYSTAGAGAGGVRSGGFE